MQELTQYLYDNLIQIQIATDANIITRNRTVYTRTVKVYRGIDQKLKLQFKNQDQKKVDMTGKTPEFHMLDDVTGDVWFSRFADIVDATKGIFTVQLYETDFLPMDREFYNYSVRVIDNTTDVSIPTYTDDNYFARGEIQLLPGHYPEFHPSTVVALDKMYTPTPYSPFSVNTTSIVASDATIGRKNTLHTAQFYFNSSFTGTITIEATLDAVADFVNGNWFTVDTLTFTNQTQTTYTNWIGVYTFARFKIIPTSGTIAQILYRS